MKTLRLIMTNLILVFTLVILTSGVVFAADNWDVAVSVTRDTNNVPDTYSLKIMKNNNILSIEDLKEFTFVLGNADNETDYDTIVFTIFEDGKIADDWGDDIYNANVTYDASNKAIKIKPDYSSTARNIPLGRDILNLKIDIREDYTETVLLTTRKLEEPVQLNLTFKVTSYYSNGWKYFLHTEGGNLQSVGKIIICDKNGNEIERPDSISNTINLISNKYTFGQAITIKQASTGKVLGTATIPKMDNLAVVYKANSKDISFKAGSPLTTLSASDFKSFGWTRVDLKKMNTQTTYTYNFNTNTGNGISTKSNGTIFTVSEYGGYDITFYMDDFKTYSLKAYPIDTSLFTAKLVLEENGNYSIVYNTPLSKLEALNAGKAFKIGIYDLQDNRIPNRDVDSTWHSPSETKQTFGADTQLQLNEYGTKVKIKFSCIETGLNKEIEVEIPKPEMENAVDDTWNASISLTRDAAGIPDTYTLKILKSGAAVPVENLEDFSIKIENITPNLDTHNIYDLLMQIDSNGQVIQTVKVGDVTYNSSTKAFSIKMDNSRFGSVVEKVRITIEDAYGNTKTVEKTLENTALSNLKFRISTYYDKKWQYFLHIEGMNLSSVGKLVVYVGEVKMEEIAAGSSLVKLINNNYHPGQTLTIKQVTSGKVLGTAEIPQIDKITASYKVNSKDIYFKLGTTSDAKTLSISDFKSFGWTKVEFKKIGSGGKTYTVDLSTGVGNGISVKSGGTVFTLPEAGGYEINFYMSAMITYSLKAYPIDTTLFTAKLVRENLEYSIVYETPLSKLQEANAEKEFKIGIYDLKDKLIPDKEVDSTWHSPSEIKQTFGKDTPLYLDEYDTKVKIRFSCEETGLFVEVIVEVPKLDELSDLTAKIDPAPKPEESSAIVKVLGKENNTLSMLEFYKVLQYGEDVDILDICNAELCYEYNGINVLDENENHGKFDSSKDQFTFNKFSSFKDHYIEDVKANLEAWEDKFNQGAAVTQANQMMVFYRYYKAIKANGSDIPLFLREVDANGNVVRVNVERPNISSNYPWFEAITGVKFEEYEAIVGELETAVAGLGEAVSGDTLFISADEDYKNFYVPESGIYYIYQMDGTGINSKIPYICIPTMISNDEKPLMFAGRFTGEAEENKPLGEYVYYNGGQISFGVDDIQANCYPLIENALYKIKNYSKKNITIKFIRLDINGDGSNYDLVEIFDETTDNLYLSSQSLSLAYQQVQAAYILGDNYSFFQSLEHMLAWFVRTLANGLNYLVQSSLQSISDGKTSATIDMDSLIFNNYPDTSISFFTSNAGGENPSRMIGMFRDGVNNWYGVFTAIAIAGYIVILLYIGVKILISVGGDKQSQAKDLLASWVIGIIILAFYPYVIKYAIDINNGLVETIEEAKVKVLNIQTINNSMEMSDFSLPTNAEAEQYDALSAKMDENPFSESNRSYMAAMSKKAHKAPYSLVDAVVYLVMTWQFIMIVIMYYKRVFIIAFLIAIFPFVALSYAIDKLGDGKAQALSVWTKEIVINIFIQSIHALVYVFVLGATYTGGEYSGDWLLSIIGIMFLFQGEQIFRKIIGQSGGDTIKSLSQTAKRTIATITAAKYATERVSDNLIGAKSHLGRTVNTYRKWKTEKRIARNMDFLAPAKPKFVPAKPGENGVPSTGNKQYDNLSGDIQTLNNMDKLTDPRAMAKALDNVLANMNSKDPNIQSLLNGLNLSDDQLNALSKLKNSMVNSILNADTSDPENYKKFKEKIDQDLDITLEMVFPESVHNRELMKRAMYYELRDGNRDKKHKRRNLKRKEIKAELIEARNRRLEFYNPASMSNPFVEEAKARALSSSAISKRDSILSTHFNTSASNATAEQLKLAESVAMLSDFKESSKRGTARYSAKQLIDSARYRAKHETDSKANRNAIKTLNIGAEEAKAIIAEEVAKTYTDVSEEPTGNYKRAIANGAGADIPEPLTGSTIEKKLAINNMTKAYDMALEEIAYDDEKAGDKLCYDETLDEFSVKDILRLEKESGWDIDTYIDYVVHERENKNKEEVFTIEQFAAEMLGDLPELSDAPTYEYLTKEEHEKYSKALRAKFVEELARTSTTTAGVALGATIGAGINIGLSDDKSAIEEAFNGILGGAIVGDVVAERGIGRENQVQEVTIINPYTGEARKFDLQREGILTSDIKLLAKINPNEVLRYDDPRLSPIKYDLTRKFLEDKQQFDMEQELKRKRDLYSGALKNKKK